MYNPTSLLGNETHKLLGDFEIQTDQLISARRPDLIIIKKKKKKKKKTTCKIVDFAVPADHSAKLKVKRRINTLTLLGIEETVEHESDNYSNCNWFGCLGFMAYQSL